MSYANLCDTRNLNTPILKTNEYLRVIKIYINEPLTDILFLHLWF